MHKDLLTAISFRNLSPMRHDRLSALLSGAERAWRVYDAQVPYAGNGVKARQISMTVASYHATDAQKASARLLRIGRR